MVSIEDKKIKPTKKIVDDLKIQIIYVPLESKTGVSKSQYYNNPIELAAFKDKATTITYTFFKDSNNEFHFLSSEIN